jgi:hypothetical protein
MNEHGSQMGRVRHIPSYPLERLGFEVKPTLADYRAWLDGQKSNEDKAAKLADQADQADAAQQFPI